MTVSISCFLSFIAPLHVPCTFFALTFTSIIFRKKPWVTGVAAPKNSFLQSPSMILKKSPGLTGSAGKRATAKEYVSQVAKLRPPIDSPASAGNRQQIIRQTSI